MTVHLPTMQLGVLTDVRNLLVHGQTVATSARDIAATFHFIFVAPRFNITPKTILFSNTELY